MLGKYTQSKWLKSEDFDGPIPVTIQFAEEVEFKAQEQGGKAEWKVSLTFREFDKALILNMTNIRMLQFLFGDDAEPKDLIGKSILLTSEPTQTPQGTMTMGIRLKPLEGQAPVQTQGQLSNPGMGATKSDRPPTPVDNTVGQGQAMTEPAHMADQPPPPTDEQVQQAFPDAEEPPF